MQHYTHCRSSIVSNHICINHDNSNATVNIIPRFNTAGEIVSRLQFSIVCSTSHQNRISTSETFARVRARSLSCVRASHSLCHVASSIVVRVRYIWVRLVDCWDSHNSHMLFFTCTWMGGLLIWILFSVNKPWPP